jgi:serine/threonine protein kinase
MSNGPSTTPEGQAPDTGPPPGEIIAQKYVVESLIGVGGMGLVLAARHIQLNQRVAIKLLRKESALVGSSASRFLREARAAAALASEHVARVLDVGTLENGLPYIVMEFLSGSDLAGLVQQRGRIPYPEAVSLVLQACEAIAEAHALGIIHRDLKPSNVFVTQRPDGTALVKVLDFGISKFQNPLAFAGEEATLTASGSVVGSPAYMSPEQIRSAKGTDARSDVWAMGVILHELLTGQNPFIGETLGDTLVKIASEPAPSVRDSVPEVPTPLAFVIKRCLERDPAQRVGSIADLARALEPFAGGDMSSFVARIVRVATSTRPVSVTPSDGDPIAASGATLRMATPQETDQAWHQAPEQAKSRRRVTWTLAAGLLAAAAIAGGVSLSRPTRPVAPPRAGELETTTADLLPPPRPVEPLTSAAPVALDAAAPPGAPNLTSSASAAPSAPSASRVVDATHATDHRHGHHPLGAPVPQGRADSGATGPAPPSSSSRSLDDLLEGRQ